MACRIKRGFWVALWSQDHHRLMQHSLHHQPKPICKCNVGWLINIILFICKMICYHSLGIFMFFGIFRNEFRDCSVFMSFFICNFYYSLITKSMLLIIPLHESRSTWNSDIINIIQIIIGLKAYLIWGRHWYIHIHVHIFQWI